MRGQTGKAGKEQAFVIGLDAIDGSSLIDIKPYVKELDEAEA